MPKRSILINISLIVIAALFCTKPLNPLDIYSNAGIEPHDLTDSSYTVEDTVPITIDMNLPHLIDYIVLSAGDYDTTIHCRYEESYKASLIIHRLFSSPDSIIINYETVLKNGTIHTHHNTLVIRGLAARVQSGPPPERYVSEGKRCTLSVVGTGTEPLKYQWYKGGDTLFDDTAASLTFDLFGQSDTGVYTCEISNSWGKDVSEPVKLILRPLGDNAAYWNFDSYTDSVPEGDSLVLSVRPLYSNTDGKEVLLNRLAHEDKCNFKADSSFIFRAGRLDSGRYVVPVSIQSDSSIDIATIEIFVHPTYHSITIQADSGSIEITPDLPAYRWGDTIIVRAVPTSGYTFFEWDGDLSGNESTKEVVITDDLNIRARFWPETNDGCNTVEDGALNRAIREDSPSSRRPGLLCPAPGLYEEGTVEIQGKVRIVIQ